MRVRVARTSLRGNNDKPCEEASWRYIGYGKDAFDWFVELSDLRELRAFCEKYGNVVIEPPTEANDGYFYIEIYDDCRE